MNYPVPPSFDLEETSFVSFVGVGMREVIIVGSGILLGIMAGVALHAGWQVKISSGTMLAGFQITALPKASAGAIFQTAVAVGKFHGEIIATVPTGSRRTSTSIPSRTDSALSPIWRNTSAA